jgi:hypothetical protein
MSRTFCRKHVRPAETYGNRLVPGPFGRFVGLLLGHQYNISEVLHNDSHNLSTERIYSNLLSCNELLFHALNYAPDKLIPQE